MLFSRSETVSPDIQLQCYNGMQHPLPLASSIDNCSLWLTLFCNCEHHSVDQKKRWNEL